LGPDEPVVGVVGVVAAVPDFRFRFRAVDFIVVVVFRRFVSVIKV
jgi:hypothetical protein